MEQDLYGLNTLNVRPKSILELILTCETAKQLEWTVKYRVLEADYPSGRAMKRWKRAIRYMQDKLGTQVMIEGEPAVEPGGTGDGG